MAEPNSVNLSPSALKTLNKTRKRKININEWKDVKRKTLRNSGKEYEGRNMKRYPAKNQPKEVSGITLYCSIVFWLIFFPPYHSYKKVFIITA